MLKRLFAILSVVLGTIMFLSGCSKDNHNTLAFIGDESEMKSCYEIYPQQYFPSEISDLLREGRFPPDIVGEYEMRCHKEDESGAIYYPPTQQTMPLNNESVKSLCFIVENQINGMAKITIGLKNYGPDYQWNDPTDVYIYGNVYDEDNSKMFMLCYQSIQGDDNTTYKIYNGNIITGTIDKDGIKNVDYWFVVKQVNVNNPSAPYPIEGSYAHYHADFAERKAK